MSTTGVREHSIARDTFHYKWDNSLPPAVEIAPGDVVHFDTEEVTSGQLNKGDDPSQLGKLDFDRLYPLAGPPYAKGAQPGDVLPSPPLPLHPRPRPHTALLPAPLR